MVQPATRALVMTCASALAACSRADATASRVLEITGDAVFDDDRLTLIAAQGETLGIRVAQRDPLPVRIELPGASVRTFEVERFTVVRPSTTLFGGSRGPGSYPDGLLEVPEPAVRDVFVEISAERDSRGVMMIGERRIPIELRIAPVVLATQTPHVWAYVDPSELGANETRCAQEFRERGVLLSPDLPMAWWSERKRALAGVQDVPVVISADPVVADGEVRAWIAATRGTGQVPFAIPIDEPRTPEARAKVVALAKAVRAAGGGQTTFRYAVTDVPRPEYGDLIDLYISLDPTPRSGAWRYNGAPPSAGSMVLDAVAPGPRTWGWIAFRDDVPQWYVWDALYWHDRHNRKGAPRPGRALDVTHDPVSFDDGEDHGNLDGVLALPATQGCRPTLRLAALGRGQQDRRLLELAAKCSPGATTVLANLMMPRTGGWATSDKVWESARRAVIALASCR